MTTLQRVIKYCAIAFAVFLIVSIISGICGAIGMVSGLVDEDVVGDKQIYTISSDIESLEIEVSAANLEIVTGDCFSVESNHKYLEVRENNGTLRIAEKKVIFGLTSNDVKVVLTVPEDFCFKEADISTGAGMLRVDTLTADELKLDLGAGAAELDCLNAASEAVVNGGAGKLTIHNGQMHDLSLDIGIGMLELTGRITGKSTIDYGISDAEVTLLGNKEDYKIEIDKGVGSATLDGKAMADDSVYGGGDNCIDVDGGVGSIRIRFADK